MKTISIDNQNSRDCVAPERQKVHALADDGFAQEISCD